MHEADVTQSASWNHSNNCHLKEYNYESLPIMSFNYKPYGIVIKTRTIFCSMIHILRHPSMYNTQCVCARVCVYFCGVLVCSSR